MDRLGFFVGVKMAKNHTKEILREFVIKWADGGRACDLLRLFAKKHKITVSEALWIFVHFSACASEDPNLLGMTDYMDGRNECG